MMFPDFAPGWARDWYSLITTDDGKSCPRPRQRDAALRLVTDSRMKLVYESLSRLRLADAELTEILSQASWVADSDWEDVRDSCREMESHKQNLEKLLRAAVDELSAMETAEGDGGAMPYVLASLPKLFEVIDLDDVVGNTRGCGLRDHLEQIADVVANLTIDLSEAIAPGVVSRKSSEFASFVRSFEDALRKQIQRRVTIPAARMFDLAAVALPAELMPKRYSRNKNSEDYTNDQQKSALIISIRKVQV